MEEDEEVEIGLNIQSSDESDNIEQTSQVITTNDGEYFINTIEITEDELNEQIQLGNVDGNHLLHRRNQDYQIQLIGTGTDLSQYEIDSVVSLTSNTTTATSTNSTTTANDIQDYTSEGNYQEVIIINAEDLESPTHHHHLGHSSSLQDFVHDNNDTITSLKTNNITNHHNKSKNKFILSNFSPSIHQQQQHSTNFILTTLEGKTFHLTSPSNELIQFPSTVSNSIPFPITSSGNIISNLTSGQQYIVPTDLHNTQNFQIVSIPPIQLQSQQQEEEEEQQQKIINQLSKHNLPSYIIQQQQQQQPQRNKTNNLNAGIFKVKEEQVNDDLNIKIKSKSVLCYPGAKTNKINKNNLNIEKNTKYQEINSIATSTTNNNKTCTTTHTVSSSSSSIGEKMLRVVNDNNQTLTLETDDEINYQIEGEDDDEEMEATIGQISTKNTKNMVVISTVDTSMTTKATTVTPTVSSSVSFGVTDRMTENKINNTANTVNVSIPGLPGVVCQLQRFMYTHRLCRVCLLAKSELVSIFEDVNIKSNGQIENSRGPHSAHRYNIIPAIKTLLDIEVKYGDGLPDQICSQCIDNLMSFSVFRKKISIGHSKLNAIFAQVKGTSSPTLIPELGERDMKKTDVYRHVDAIVKARELMNNSAYKHMISRSISDRVLEKIFQALSVVVGFKSGKFKDLEHYVLNEPYVTSWFCYPCNRSIQGPKEIFAQHNVDVHHIKSASDVLYPCDLCNQSFSLVDSSGQNYGEHWLQHLFFYECTECNKKMPSHKGLWSHKRSAHSISNKVFQCDHKNCDKTFSKKPHLDAHKKTHLNPEDRKRFLNWCKICGKGLTSSLAAHMSGVHSENRPYKCDICSKQFKRKEILVGHRENVHLNLKKFACEHKDCAKRFYTTQSLKAHVHKHQDTTTFSCPICNKQIRTKSNYFKHLKIHQRCNEEAMNKETDQMTM